MVRLYRAVPAVDLSHVPEEATAMHLGPRVAIVFVGNTNSNAEDPASLFRIADNAFHGGAI